MQRTPATIEEQLILKAIGEECAWENLPKRLQSFLSSKEEWHRRIIEHCIKKRLQWNTSFAHKVCKEGEYYEEMMRYLRRNLALFPYHLAEYICRVMRISPFKYYCDIIFEVMKNEQPYDSIPNFSAADALRLTGIGRNEFIDLMIKCRSKKIMWKLNKSIAKELLPLEPVQFVIEPWWGVCLVNFTLEEFKKLTEEEMATIDKICKEEANSFILFDPVIIKGLYNRGLVYFDVPVYPDDRFKVSRLEGFVSNREQQYEDPIEELLYAVFVVSSESSTVAELATTLQSDLSQLQAAASFACRLGWAVKLIDVASILQEPNISGFSKNSIGDEEDIHAAMSSLSLSGDRTALQQGDALWSDNPSPAAFGYSRVAFIVDANITSYLMMGSVSPGLKSHAITLYEAGKLGHESIADLCTDLATLEGAKFEGELQEFANHAFSLRCILECLTSGGISSNQVENVAATSINKDGNSPNSDMRNGNLVGEDPGQLNSEGDASAGPLNQDTADGNLSGAVQISDAGKEAKKAKKYRVDILRCESLASLAPATLDRLFHRDYGILMSMVPLPPSSILPGSKGPIHFGPPSNSSMTPWMKLVLYSVLSSGPLSVVLMKGQCLRLLPAPLAGCEKALIWSWDGSNIGGLGGKFEGDLVKGSILLHCLNSLLRYSAVLVQPLSKHDLDNNGKIVTLDFPLPLKNSDGSVVSVGPELGLCDAETSKLNMLLQAISSKLNLWTIGYIRVLRLYKEREPGNLFADDENYEWVPLSVEFGVPLFSPKLCSSICRRVVSSQLLQTDFFNEYHEAMQDCRSRLRDVCAEYQATGPTARLLYQKELQKEEKDSSRRLMTYASGKWNPLTDSSSPISGASGENQRLKLANRQRYRTEILSFDGNILRSYSLTPDYEAAARDAAVAAKSESEDGDSKEVILPGVNLLFDGSELRPFEIGACLQARQPISLIAEASAASASLAAKQKV